MNIFTKLGYGAIAMGLLFLSSCASSYKPLNAPSAPYTFTEKTNGLVYSYQYDLLQLYGNKKYAKREAKKHLRVVAVKVTNTTDSTLHIGNDYKFLLGNTESTPVPPTVAYKQLKQGMVIYLLFLPLNPTLTITENGVVTNSTTIPLGPPLSVYNMIVAANANSKFKQELITQDIQHKSVAPGETVFGLVTFQTISAAPVRLEKRNPVLNASIETQE